MCYRCEVCGDVVPHRSPRRVWPVYRKTDTGKEIAREWAVCEECHDDLCSGVKLSLMLQELRHGRDTVPLPAPTPPKAVPLPVRPRVLLGAPIRVERRRAHG